MTRFLFLALILWPIALAAQPVPEPDGFRQELYLAPVPATLQGAAVIDVDQAHSFWQSGEAVFIDVLPRAPKPDGLPEGTVWLDRPRDSIPGAIWLPNTGYGRLAPETETYLRKGLDMATGGDLSKPLVIFCKADCWMSWNAAKRAVEWGYTDVRWFPEGTDGWDWMEFPLERLEPSGG